VSGWIPGVTRHARKRAEARLGTALSRETWAAILDGIEHERFPRAKRTTTEEAIAGSLYLVPAERDGRPCTLPVVAKRSASPTSEEPQVVIVTVLPLEYPR
jgi:hypothetical protein